jgi:hypothetical protein
MKIIARGPRPIMAMVEEANRLSEIERTNWNKEYGDVIPVSTLLDCDRVAVARLRGLHTPISDTTQLYFFIGRGHHELLTKDFVVVRDGIIGHLDREDDVELKTTRLGAMRGVEKHHLAQMLSYMALKYPGDGDITYTLHGLYLNGDYIGQKKIRAALGLPQLEKPRPFKPIALTYEIVVTYEERQRWWTWMQQRRDYLKSSIEKDILSLPTSYAASWMCDECAAGSFIGCLGKPKDEIDMVEAQVSRVCLDLEETIDLA